VADGLDDLAVELDLTRQLDRRHADELLVRSVLRAGQSQRNPHDLSAVRAVALDVQRHAE
jgi:hypothetical protein